MKLFVHFLKSNTQVVPDFFYVIKYKKGNIKLNFEKNRLNVLNMRRKTKDKFLCTV